MGFVLARGVGEPGRPDRFSWTPHPGLRWKCGLGESFKWVKTNQSSVVLRKCWQTTIGEKLFQHAACMNYQTESLATVCGDL